MSSTWREFMSWNKYTQVASRALRQALGESERVAAEKRAQVGARVQIWENGQAGELNFIAEQPKVRESGPGPV
ncbi:hypothetical protein Q5752_007067 [Cryptotrichosporon argae]